ncbi:hypothetical protein A3Q56_02757 [Intoshia linei]|uniref:Protein FRA10AC1 n=1 Tax=Intoshia linei TaxID=1819745 RepID=A0A177B5U4_9BILA|nr:hypothetical protein A3Q56_02757 [Intoshia linei]
MASSSKKMKLMYHFFVYSTIFSENKEKDKQQIHMDAYSRHKDYVNTYLRIRNMNVCENGKGTKEDEEYDLLQKNYQFIKDDKKLKHLSQWEIKLVNKYYNRLYKEYCISNIKHYKSGRIAMRWRTEKEVIIGKGQFICGSTRCDSRKSLTSWEVNFNYVENEENKSALVKLRLCPPCSIKINYRKRKKTGYQQLKFSKKTIDTVIKKPKSFIANIDRQNLQFY